MGMSCWVKGHIDVEVARGEKSVDLRDDSFWIDELNCSDKNFVIDFSDFFFLSFRAIIILMLKLCFFSNEKSLFQKYFLQECFKNFALEIISK